MAGLCCPPPAIPAARSNRCLHGGKVFGCEVRTRVRIRLPSQGALQLRPNASCYRIQLPRRRARPPRGDAIQRGLMRARSRIHENVRYVKLAWIGLVCGLALPAPARAEIVAPTTSQGLLAMAPDGSPRVAYLSGRDLVLAQRTASGWVSKGLGHAAA